MQLALVTEWRDEGRRKLEATKAAVDFDLERLSSLLNAWISTESKKGVQTSPRTREAYTTGLRSWVKWCRPDVDQSPRVPLLRASKDDVKLWAAELLESGLKPETVANYLSGVHAFYEAVHWAGAVSSNPAHGVRRPKDPRPRWERRPPVPWDGFKEMLARAGNERDLAILHVLGVLGLRISEAVALNVEDVRGGQVKVRKGKGSKARTVPMPAPTKAVIAAWLAVREAAEGEPALFVNLPHVRMRKDLVGRRVSTDSIRKMFNRLLDVVGLEQIYSPHCARHTGLTMLYRKSGKDLNLTARVAGHSSVSTTEIYAHMDLDDVQSAMDKVGEGLE